MSDDLVIVPSDGDGYVELARTKQGRLFRKHILNKGTLLHPTTGSKITIDDAFVATMKQNFANNVCDIVQVPLANDKNEHTEDPNRNIGEVIGIEEKDDKVYVVLDARDETAADRLGKTLLGASAMLHLDYTDTKTGTKVGPTLLHTCVTNRPYVTGLDNYEEIVGDVVAATHADKSDRAVVLLSDNTLVVEPPASTPTEETSVGDTESTTTETATPAKPSLEELLSMLKTEHNIDVTGLQAKAAESDAAAKLSNTIAEALKDAGVVKLANDTTAPSTEDVIGAVSELATNNVALTNRIHSLEKRDAENAVDKLIASGHIMPKQKAGFVELKLSNPAMFDQLVPGEPVVKLSNENGANEPNAEQHNQNIDQEVARLAALINAKK